MSSIAYKEKPIPTVIIGLGRIAHLLEDDPYRQKPCTHLGAIQSLPTAFSLVAGIDPDPKKQRAFRDRFPKAPPALYRSVEDFLQFHTPKPHWLFVIASKTRDHFDNIQTLLPYQPTFLIEKPIVANEIQAHALKKIKTPPIAFLNYERRYHPHYLWLFHTLKERLDKDPPLAIEMRVFAKGNLFDLQNPDQNPMIHDATHMVDLYLWLRESLLGPCLNKQITLNQDHFLGHFVHQLAVGNDTVSITFRIETRAQHFGFGLSVYTGERAYHIGNGYFHIEEKQPSPFYKGFYSLSPWPKQKIKRHLEQQKNIDKNPWIGLYKTIARSMKEKPHSPTSDWHRALENILLMYQWLKIQA